MKRIACRKHISRAVAEMQSQGFDPSEFPVLSAGSRLRHDSSGGLISSSALSRQGYGARKSIL